MYHAHLYYTPETKHVAETIHRQIIQAELPIEQLGFMHDEPVGPHPQAMFQVTFIDCYLMDILEWLECNREGHPVLIHPVTDHELMAHTQEAIWLGEALVLNTEILKT